MKSLILLIAATSLAGCAASSSTEMQLASGLAADSQTVGIDTCMWKKARCRVQ